MPESKRSDRFWTAFKYACRDYTSNTQVHGFFYLRPNESQGFKRIFWSLVIILSFLVGAVLLAHLIANFFVAPFQITLGHPEILMKIPFPSISLCHSQTVVDFHARQFIDKM